MKKIVRLTESDLRRIVKRVIKEQGEQEWLKYPNDNSYEYQKRDGKWFAKNKSGKEFDLSNPKFKKTVDNLNKQFPDEDKSLSKTITNDKTETNTGDKKTDPSVSGNGGPLIGQLVSRVDDESFEWGDTVEFEFSGLKNSGEGPITINKFMGRSDNMTSDLKLPMTVPAGGNTGPFTVKVRLEEGGTTVRPDMNGVVDYDVPAYLITDGKKQKYMIYCRGNFYVS